MKTTTWNNDRASVLVVAVIFSAVMAMSVASFLQLAKAEARLAHVAFYSNSCLNLAEAGVERALFALNNEDWTGWTVAGDEAQLDAVEVDLGGNVNGTIQARVESISNDPIVVAEGAMDLPNRPSVIKQVKVKLSRRSLFANGITTRRGVTFKGGNAFVASYRSSWGKPRSPWWNIDDNGSIASVSVEADAITLSNSRIYGRVATGGSWPIVGPNGRIYGKDTLSGMKVDPERVALDFAADFPLVSPPTAFDTYIPAINSSMTLGTPGATEPTFIKVDSISLSSSDLLAFQGPVVIYLTGDASVSGTAEIRVLDESWRNASATFFVDGNFYIGGNGAVNATNDPANLMVYGTSGNQQYFKLHGSATWQAAVYAPNAKVDMNGGGSTGAMAGAIVADSVFMNGNYEFFYDEDLEDRFADDTGYGMELWRELYRVADRVAFNEN